MGDLSWSQEPRGPDLSLLLLAGCVCQTTLQLSFRLISTEVRCRGGASGCTVPGPWGLVPLGPASGNSHHSQELWRGQPYLEAVLEFPADEVESHRVDAGVEGGHVDPEVIHH